MGANFWGNPTNFLGFTTNLVSLGTGSTTPSITAETSKQAGLEAERETTIVITFEALTLVNVNPDPSWYYPTYLNKVGQLGQWQEGRTNEDVFGPGGFHSIVTGFVAAYRPKFEITKSNASLGKALSKGHGLSLGPIPVDTSGKDFMSTRNGDTITIQSNSTYGQILGVCVQNPCAES